MHVSNTATAQVTYDTRVQPSSVLGGLLPAWTWNEQPTLALTAGGKASLLLALRPKVSVSVSHILSASVKADLMLQMEGDFAFPVFAALPSGSNYDKDPSQPSHFHEGRCDTPHALQYQVSAGIMNAVVAAGIHFDWLGNINKVLDRFNLDRDLGQFGFPDHVLPMLSGCLLPQQQPSTPWSVSLQMPSGSPFSFALSSDLPNLRTNLGLDVADSVGVDRTRLVVQLLDSAGEIVGDSGGQEQVVQAVVHVLDSDANGAASAQDVHTQVVGQMGDANSAMRTQGLITKGLVLKSEQALAVQEEAVRAGSAGPALSSSHSSQHSSLSWRWIGVGACVLLLLLVSLVALVLWKRAHSRRAAVLAASEKIESLLAGTEEMLPVQVL